LEDTIALALTSWLLLMVTAAGIVVQ
jgi:hypothetical protein